MGIKPRSNMMILPEIFVVPKRSPFGGRAPDGELARAGNIGGRPIGAIPIVHIRNTNVHDKSSHYTSLPIVHQPCKEASCKTRGPPA